MPEPVETAPRIGPKFPLLGDAPHIVERFERIAAVFAKLGEDPLLLERPEVQKAHGDFLRLDERLRRPRYQVGFLGTTQAAKSTTILNLLDRKKGEGPVDSGDGAPKTSSITRIVPQSEGEHTLRIRYLTPAQYAEKRARLCEKTGLDPDSSDATVLEQLDKQLAGPAAGARPAAAEVPPLIRDLETLGKLVRSYGQYRAMVVDRARVEPHPYAKRESFVNHPPEVAGQRFAPSPNHLIREVEIGLTSERLPQRLEMIDLPGLGSDGSSDDILTKGFLHELDGALVFLRADQYGDSDVEYIMSKLIQEFEGGRSRIWIVVTKMDVIERDSLYGKAADELLGFLRKHGLKTDQLALTTKRLHDRRGPDGKVPLSQAAAIVQINLDDADPVPPGYRADPGLKASFAELLGDGGTARLRKMVTEELEGRVAADTQRQAGEQLGRIAERLVGVVEFLRQVTGGNLELLVLAEQCRTAVTREVAALDQQMAWFADSSQQVRNELDAMLDKCFPGDEDNLQQKSADLARRFPAHAKILTDTLAATFQSNVVLPAYEKVAAQLANEAFAAVPVGDKLGPGKYWEAAMAADAALKADWRRTGFPTFQADLAALFAPPGEGEEEDRELNGGHYREMLQEKIRAVVGEGVHRLRAQLRVRLSELRDQLNQLADFDPQALGPTTVDFDALLAELRTLCPSR